MLNEGTIYIKGIDPGSHLIGVSEWTLKYKTKNGFIGSAYIDDFYTLKIPQNIKHDERLVYINDIFDKDVFKVCPDGSRYDRKILCIENVPHVRNAAIAAKLHETTAAILIPFVREKYEIIRFVPGTWKKEAIGNGCGNYKKEQIVVWALGGNLPIEPDNIEEDSIDALCIGLAGMKRITAQLGYEAKRQQDKLEIQFKN